MVTHFSFLNKGICPGGGVCPVRLAGLRSMGLAW